MKQSQLSQRLESVRQEMSYSAGGVDDLIENTDDATVESSQLASDELAHYVLIKGNVDKESTANDDTAIPGDKDTLEDGEVEDEEWKPVPMSSNCRMNDEFVIRKIEKDRNAGRKFAPVCEVKLSSSSSSSDEDDDRQCSATKSSSNVMTAASANIPRSLADNSIAPSISGGEKRNLPPSADEVEAKRRRSDDELSMDSVFDDESSELAKSPPVLKGASVTEPKSPASPVTAKTPIVDVLPITAPCESDSTDVRSLEPVIDESEELDTEAVKRDEEINAETGEVCFKEPLNDGKSCVIL